jgi:uncharacterized membrane protein
MVGRTDDTHARRVTVAEIGRGFDARLIAVTGVWIAVVFVMTRVIQISIGASGYLHFGDVALYVAAFLFGPLVAFVSAAVGMSLADLQSGYGSFAPGTFVIHGLQAIVAGLLAWRGGPRRMGIATTAGGIIVVLGYFLYQWIMISAGALDGEEGESAFATALAAIGLNFIQVVVAALVAIPLVMAVRQAYPPIRRWGAGPSWMEE